jgi:hypothetical protein
MKKKVNKTYYHGTNMDGVMGIAKSKGVFHNYNGEIGVFITEDFNHAINFGQYVLVIKNVDKSKLTESDSEDGLFYNGILPIDCIETIYSDYLTDARVIRDIEKCFA